MTEEHLKVLKIEKQLTNLDNGSKIDSRDYRVVQSIAELALFQDKKADYSNPECVNKSWPQFWDFLKYTEKVKS